MVGGRPGAARPWETVKGLIDPIRQADGRKRPPAPSERVRAREAGGQIWLQRACDLRLEQFETALKHAEAGILIEPDVATEHLLRAIAFRGLSRVAEVETSIQEAIKSNQWPELELRRDASGSIKIVAIALPVSVRKIFHMFHSKHVPK
jgi:hypothetical protein